MFKNKIILRLFTFAFVAAFALTAVSCKPEENNAVQLSRLFRPSSFNCLVDGTNVTLSWTPIKNATYLIEYGRLASGLPFDSVKDMQTIELPSGITSYQLLDLWGSTRYGIRIKAVSTIPGTNDSEWVVTSFTTDAENIFYPITFTPDGSDFKIFISWDIEKEVTHIVVNNLQLGDKVFEISTEEKAVGMKTLVSAPEYRFRNGQLYTISIWLGERKRGENSVILQR